MIDIESLKASSEELDKNLQYFNAIGLPILQEYSAELDDILVKVKGYLDRCRELNLEFDLPTLQHMLLNLTSIIFFTNEKMEKLGLLEDTAKLQYQSAYNDAYLKKQGYHEAGTKYSVQQLKSFAEQEAMSEYVLYLIYERCSKIITDKVNSANEVAKALSKIISSKITEMNVMQYSAKL